jgi:hypothetical protein
VPDPEKIIPGSTTLHKSASKKFDHFFIQNILLTWPRLGWYPASLGAAAGPLTEAAFRTVAAIWLLNSQEVISSSTYDIMYRYRKPKPHPTFGSTQEMIFLPVGIKQFIHNCSIIPHFFSTSSICLFVLLITTNYIPSGLHTFFLPRHFYNC